MQKRIWIAWERQRRSLELAQAFNACGYFLEYSGTGILRYLVLSVKTIVLLAKEKPSIVFVQNPSIFLVFLALLVRPFLRYTLVVDRHTNFKLATKDSRSIKWKLFHCLSRYTLKNADLTIVTNKYLKQIVTYCEGNAVVLPDKIPTLHLDNRVGESNRVFVVCSFADDEPFRELIEASKSMSDLTFYFSGNASKKLSSQELSTLPNNVHLLGFVSEEEYQLQLMKSDFTIVLTTLEFVLNCGSYESVSAGKPMILGGSKTIRSYFNKGAVYCDDFSTTGLIVSLNEMKSRRAVLVNEIQTLKKELVAAWDIQKAKVESELMKL